MKSGLARMAAKLIEVPFSESYGHPQTKYGYAAYECVELGGVMSLSMNDNLLTMQGIVVSLGELIDVMIYEKYYLDALPLVVLFEHIAIFYLRCARTFLDARLKRIKLLLCQHMFAEAAAMLAGIKNTILKVKNHSIVDLLRDRTNTATEDLKKFETSSNGLNFYGYEPFYNNKLPVNVDEEGNINGKALDWIAKFPADFREFSKAIVISLPIPVLSEEQLAAEEARKAAEAELASKAKGKKATKVIDTDASQSAPTRELLTPYQHLELSLVCGELLKEIGMLDNKVSNKYASSLKAIGDNSAMLFTSTLSELHSYYGSDKLSLAADLTSRNNSESPDEGNPYSYSNQCEEWIRLYCRCLINQYQYLVHQRNYKIARASISQLLLFLSSDSLATVSGDLRMVLAQTWLESKYLLIVISSCQARLEDAIDIATVSSKEASQMMCGYWLRMYIFERSRSYWKLGLLEDALSECNIVLKLYETSKYELSHRLRCMCFKATLLRERSLYEDRIVAVRMYIESLEILRLASSLALTTAHYVGAYPADSNICYERQDQMISRNDMLPPALFNLTTLHNNEPELTKYATHDLKALHISYGIDLSPSAAAVTANAPNAVYSAEATSTVHSSASITSASVTAASVAATSVASSVTGSIISMAPDGKATHEDVWLLFDRLRLAPVDSNPNVYTPSEYANIYLTEVRTLITINVALCICIDDIIGSGACNRSVKRAANKAKGTAKISTSKLNILNLEHLLVEQTVLGESSLKVRQFPIILVSN